MTTAPLQTVAAKPAPPSNSTHSDRLLQRKCECGKRTSSLAGECEECRKKRLQKKLVVGASNDPLEWEADRVADQVLGSSTRSAVRGAPLRIHRRAASA